MTTQRTLPALALAACALTGCSSITETEQNLQKYGAVNFLAKGTSATQASAATTVVFFESIGLQVPNSITQQSDQCIFAPVDTTVQSARGDRAAGTSIGITVAGATRQLPYSATDARYATPDNAPLLYTAGDVAQVSIPGEGTSFPAITGSIKLAEPLALGPLTIPAAGANLSVTWNGTNDPTAAIILQLRYANPATSPVANEQVYCALRDDGSVVIPGGLLTQFLASGPPKRSLTLVRWRTNLVGTNAANLHLTSSIDTTFVFP
ncbi:hypothetical protein [Gemmatimonas phototrophica]|uniref:hypothetical protein n=1 Tax=Gemmatimonas phototrophica TaxID=1379270 RepID=UPI0011AE7084|nr:hypothetical protein [Gemmatimonas phototrophica]